MSDSKMLNVPSRVVFVKEPPEDLSTEEMERRFSKFRGFVALRRFPNRAFVEFRSIEEASHFLHVMREEPITKNGPICRIYYDKDNGFDPTKAPSRKRKAGDSLDRDRDPQYDRAQGYYPDQPYDERARYEEYYNRPSKYRRSEHESAPRDRSPHNRSRERHREDEKKEERNDRQKERPDDDRDHYDRAPRDDHSPVRDRDERRSRGDEHNGDLNHRRERPREYVPRDHAPREHVPRDHVSREHVPREHVPREHAPREHASREQHSQSHDRPRSDRERSPERNGARDRPASGHYEERERPRFIDPVHWERTVLPFFQDMGVTSYNVERVPNYQASSTLYVNNLPPDATERELTNLFRFIPNFVQVRMIHKEGKNSFCFVDFRDPDSAYVARSLLQGYRMDSRGGIHIEYDKGRK